MVPGAVVLITVSCFLSWSNALLGHILQCSVGITDLWFLIPSTPGFPLLQSSHLIPSSGPHITLQRPGNLQEHQFMYVATPSLVSCTPLPSPFHLSYVSQWRDVSEFCITGLHVCISHSPLLLTYNRTPPQPLKKPPLPPHFLHQWLHYLSSSPL